MVGGPAPFVGRTRSRKAPDVALVRLSRQRKALRGPRRRAIREGEHRLRMEAVEGADQLSSEHFKAMQAAPFLAAKVEIEGAPMRVRIAGMAAEDVELLLPFGPAVSGADRVRQRPIESVAPGDPEQFERRVVDQVRQLLDLIVEKAVAGVKTKLALDGRDCGQIAEDDAGHPL
jgi:hypothetical protein